MIASVKRKKTSYSMPVIRINDDQLSPLLLTFQAVSISTKILHTTLAILSFLANYEQEKN